MLRSSCCEKDSRNDCSIIIKTQEFYRTRVRTRHTRVRGIKRGGRIFLPTLWKGNCKNSRVTRVSYEQNQGAYDETCGVCVPCTVQSCNQSATSQFHNSSPLRPTHPPGGLTLRSTNNVEVRVTFPNHATTIMIRNSLSTNNGIAGGISGLLCSILPAPASALFVADSSVERCERFRTDCQKVALLRRCCLAAVLGVFGALGSCPVTDRRETAEHARGHMGTEALERGCTWRSPRR